MNRFALVALLAALVSACSPQSKSDDPVVRGERMFLGLGCVQCHKIGTLGREWGPNLTMLGFRKSSAWIDRWLKDPHAWNDKTLMPDFNLSDERRADLVAYLSAQKGQAWTEKPWLTDQAKALPAHQRGKIIFDSVGCVSCHAQDGFGGYPNNNVAGGLIPALTKVTEGYTKKELHDKITHGAVPIPDDPNAEKPMLEMPKWGQQLSKQDIDSVVEYLFSLNKPKPGAKPSPDDF